MIMQDSITTELIFNELAFVIVGGVIGTIATALIILFLTPLNFNVVLAGIICGFLGGILGGFLFAEKAVVIPESGQMIIEYEEQAFVDDFEL